MHGDRVTARVERRTERGDEGRVLEVVSRRHQRLVGRLEVDGSGRGFVVPFDKRVQTDVLVAGGEPLPASRGDMVVVDLTRYPSEARGAEGRIVEVLGSVDAPGVDTTVISAGASASPSCFRPKPSRRRSAWARWCGPRTSRGGPTSGRCRP